MHSTSIGSLFAEAMNAYESLEDTQKSFGSLFVEAEHAR